MEVAFTLILQWILPRSYDDVRNFRKQMRSLAEMRRTSKMFKNVVDNKILTNTTMQDYYKSSDGIYARLVAYRNACQKYKSIRGEFIVAQEFFNYFKYYANNRRHRAKDAIYVSSKEMTSYINLEGLDNIYGQEKVDDVLTIIVSELNN